MTRPPPPKRVVLFGAGGHALEIVDHFDELNCARGYQFSAHWVDAQYADAAPLTGLPLMTEPPESSERSHWYLVPAVKSVALRQRAQQLALTLGIKLLPALIHPSVYCSRTARIGDGTVVFPGAHISTHVSIGRCAVVHANATLTHECSVGDFAFVGPGVTLCGNVVIEEGAVVGAGAVILPRRRIAAGATIAAGAVVTRDVAINRTVKGVPARG